MSDQKHKLEGAHLGPSSTVQIKDMEKHRAKPEPSLQPTPSGPKWTSVLSQTAAENNHSIDQRQTFMKRRLERRRGQAKAKFNNKTQERQDFGL